MKFNKMRDLIKYIAKYSLKNIAVFIAILLLALIIFTLFAKKVIENADNTNNIDINQRHNQNPITNPNPVPNPKPDSGLNPQAKRHIDNGTGQITSITASINSHLNENSI